MLMFTPAATRSTPYLGMHLPAVLAAWLLLGSMGSAFANDQGKLEVEPYQLAEGLKTGDTYMGYKHLGSLRLSGWGQAGHAVTGLSDLWWDEDEQLLYAVSDRGRLSHFRPRFDGEVLTGLTLVGTVRIRDRAGRPLKPGRADSEGLAASGSANGRKGDTRLFISFERHHRIAVYRPNGEWVEPVVLPSLFRDRQRYTNQNKGLEALAVHPALGLLTGPEKPMKGYPETKVVNGTRILPVASLGPPARVFQYPLFDTPNSGLVALRTLPDGSVLTMERGYGMFLLPFKIVLRQTPPLDRHSDRLGPLDTVAVLDTSDGWRLDNFEGLAWHRGTRFFMVSDDNGNALQSTLLAYFEVVDKRLRNSKPAASNTPAANQPMNPSN